MAEQLQDSGISSLLADFNTRLRDIEEKQRLIKDRVLLIGENLVLTKEEHGKELSELKAKLENMGKEMERIKDTVSSLIEEMQNFTRKSETEILARQFKMFQPWIQK